MAIIEDMSLKAYVRDILPFLNRKKNRFVMMRKNYSEALRFVITGVIATITNYGFYWLFLPLMNHSLAFFLGYVIAVVVNYILTTSFTFKVKATKKNGLGFIVSNIINFTLSEVFLNLFISLGISKQLAPIPMYAVCLPINFLVVRYVMKKL